MRKHLKEKESGMWLFGGGAFQEEGLASAKAQPAQSSGKKQASEGSKSEGVRERGGGGVRT